MKRYLFLLLSFFALSLYAQQGSLTGTAIAASDKEPMIGLTVLVKGTTMVLSRIWMETIH